jgi:hypothetical protein
LIVTAYVRSTVSSPEIRTVPVYFPLPSRSVTAIRRDAVPLGASVTFPD